MTLKPSRMHRLQLLVVLAGCLTGGFGARAQVNEQRHQDIPKQELERLRQGKAPPAAAAPAAAATAPAASPAGSPAQPAAPAGPVDLSQGRTPVQAKLSARQRGRAGSAIKPVEQMDLLEDAEEDVENAESESGKPPQPEQPGRLREARVPLPPVRPGTPAVAQPAQPPAAPAAPQESASPLVAARAAPPAAPVAPPVQQRASAAPPSGLIGRLIFGLPGVGEGVYPQPPPLRQRGIGTVIREGTMVKQIESVDTECLLPELVSLVDRASKHFGQAVVITSGYRPPGRSRLGSFHNRCGAVDMQVPGVGQGQLVSYLRNMPGAGGVGTYCHTQSVHLDIGTPRNWHYCGRSRSFALRGGGRQAASASSLRSAPLWQSQELSR